MSLEEPEVPALEELPILTVRDTVLYPGSMLPITVGRPASMALVQSLGENRTLVVLSQLDPRVEAPGPDDLFTVGTVCLSDNVINDRKDHLPLFCDRVGRVKTLDFT